MKQRSESVTCEVPMLRVSRKEPLDVLQKLEATLWKSPYCTFSRNECHERTLLRRIARTQAIEALASTLDQPNRSGAARSPRKWHGRNKGQSCELRHLNRLNRNPVMQKYFSSWLSLQHWLGKACRYQAVRQPACYHGLDSMHRMQLLS